MTNTATTAASDGPTTPVIGTAIADRVRATRKPAVRRRVPAVLAVVAALGMSACSGADDEQSVEAPAAEAPGGSVEPGEVDDGVATVADRDDANDDEVTIDLGEIGRDVIVEVFVTMTSDDLRRSVTTISARASALGGGVASSSVDYGDPAADDLRGWATLVVRVPPGSVDDLLAGVEQTGTIRSVNQSVEDVTEQLVDLDVRIENARRSVANVQGFMDEADDLTDLVLLESELTRRQTELEQLEAQQRNLGDRVALSTVTIEILPTDALPVTDDDSLTGAFSDGWNGFVGFVRGVVYAVALAWPFLVVGAFVVVALGGVRRRRRRVAPDGDGASPTG